MDYKWLNAVTVDDPYPMSRVDDLVEVVAGQGGGHAKP